MQRTPEADGNAFQELVVRRHGWQEQLLESRQDENRNFQPEPIPDALCVDEHGHI
jgi:hypothetical protein